MQSPLSMSDLKSKRKVLLVDSGRSYGATAGFVSATATIGCSLQLFLATPLSCPFVVWLHVVLVCGVVHINLNGMLAA